MITTARKAVTLLLSYMIFTKPLTEQHGSGLLLIAMGIMLKMMSDAKLPPKMITRKQLELHEETNSGVGKGEEQEDEEKRPLV
ncbi:unnamed protein product [Linum tenue]|nr:unnamed protein product [Linum tenue]